MCTLKDVSRLTIVQLGSSALWGQQQSDLACRGAFQIKHEAGFIQRHHTTLFYIILSSRTHDISFELGVSGCRIVGLSN